MPVDSTHPSYDAAIKAWELVRDTAFGGARMVKARGAVYLPMPYGQDATAFTAFIARANFFNITKRTFSAYRGFVFVENPRVELGRGDGAPNITALENDCTLSGRPFYDYKKDVVGDVVSLGRTGTLVDWADPALDDRPYFVRYETEDVINWRYAVVNGRRELVLLVLRERTTRDSSDDEYEPERATRWRVCRLLRDAAGYFVKYEIFQKDDNGEFQRVDQKTPMRGIEALDRIPFVFHNVDGDEAEPRVIPLEDLASTNIQHYQNSASLEQAIYLCGQPTLVLTGFRKDGEYVVGSSKALVSEKETATASWLQIDANSVSAISEAMESKERQMAALGARMLEQQSAGKKAEAFQTVQIRQSGEIATLTDVAISCSLTLSRILRWAVWWDDRTVEKPDDLVDDVYVELNTDYTATKLTSDDAVKLFTVYQGSGISYEEFFYNLQRGGIIRSETDIEDEKKALKDRPIALPDLTGGTGFPPGKGPPTGNPLKKPPPGTPPTKKQRTKPPPPKVKAT
jgi:hypothetical protein